MIDTQDRDKALRKAGKELAKAYMLMTFAMDHIEEAEEEIKKAGLMRNETKRYAGMVHQAHDRFLQYFQRFIGKDDGKVILSDYERLKPNIDEILDRDL